MVHRIFLQIQSSLLKSTSLVSQLFDYERNPLLFMVLYETRSKAVSSIAASFSTFISSSLAYFKVAKLQNALCEHYYCLHWFLVMNPHKYFSSKVVCSWQTMHPSNLLLIGDALVASQLRGHYRKQANSNSFLN